MCKVGYEKQSLVEGAKMKISYIEWNNNRKRTFQKHNKWIYQTKTKNEFISLNLIIWDCIFALNQSTYNEHSIGSHWGNIDAINTKKKKTISFTPKRKNLNRS